MSTAAKTEHGATASTRPSLTVDIQERHGRRELERE
jgi:hypothetical protein